MKQSACCKPQCKCRCYHLSCPIVETFTLTLFHASHRRNRAAVLYITRKWAQWKACRGCWITATVAHQMRPWVKHRNYWLVCYEEAAGLGLALPLALWFCTGDGGGAALGSVRWMGAWWCPRWQLWSAPHTPSSCNSCRMADLSTALYSLAERGLRPHDTGHEAGFPAAMSSQRRYSEPLPLLPLLQSDNVSM